MKWHEAMNRIFAGNIGSHIAVCCIMNKSVIFGSLLKADITDAQGGAEQ